MRDHSDQNYDDIILLPHHISKTRPQMSRQNRAAQFSPFAALTGYDAAIQEAGRLTEQRAALTESSKERLDKKIHMILDRISQQPEITITYFAPDAWKEGGSYVSVTGCVKKIDSYEQTMILTNETKIPIAEIFDLEGAIFQDMD